MGKEDENKSTRHLRCKTGMVYIHQFILSGDNKSPSYMSMKTFFQR